MSVFHFPAAREVAKAEDERFADSIAHRGPLALGTYQTCFAQDAEVLGSVGLLEAAHAVDFAHAARAAAKTLQNAQAGRVGKRGEEVGHAVQLALVDFGHVSIYLYFITKW